MKQRSWILIGVAATVVIGTLAYGLSPFLAFSRLKDAAKSGNRDRLEDLVDFPIVRENLKSELAAGLMKSITANPQARGNPFAGVGALLIPAITDRMVDSIVTPDGIALVLSRGKVSRPGEEPSAESPATKDSSNIKAVFSYKTLNRFHADLRRRDQPEMTLALTLERRGWFAWRLIRIDIPQSLFDSTPPTADVATADTASPQEVNSAPAATSDENASNESSGSDLCRAVALVHVPSIENPESALAPGEVQDSVTQYRVSKKTGVGSFCSHGGYCYPRFITIGGKLTEALQLQNCRIGGKTFEYEDDTGYSVDLDRSKNSQADLKYNDLTKTLSSMGLCNACADNAAQYYLQKPSSGCGLLVKSALEGDRASKKQLLASPYYCHWRQ